MAQARTFRKTTATRVHAAICLAVLLPLFVHLLGSPGAPLVARLVLGTLALLAVLFAGSAFGDRYTLRGERLQFDNRFLARTGISPGRELDLGQIAGVREHRGRTLFIRDVTGRRFVLDAVRDYVELRDAVLHAVQESRRSS